MPYMLAPQERYRCLAAMVTVFALTGLPAAAADDSAVCPPDVGHKDGICGHALAAMARFQAMREGPPIAPDENQADTDITHVWLDLSFDHTNKILSGTVTFDVASSVNGLSQFTLDLQSNMPVDAVLINGVAAIYTRPTDKIQITLDHAYNHADTFQCAVTYHGSPQSSGFGSFSWTSTLIATLSEPWLAHTWWPCKEVYTNIDDKFTADMWMTVPNTFTAITNGLLQGTDTLSGNRKRYRWHEAYPINTYLISLAIANYQTWSATYFPYAGGQMPVTVHRYSGSGSGIPEALALMLTAFGSPASFGEYPFVQEKYGIAQFDWAGGMEHQTITSQGSFGESINAHELSHQWWGDSITCKTWHDIWLNESFATWSEARWMETKPGGSFLGYKNSLAGNRPTIDSGTVYCYDITDINRVFSGNLTYDKGGWVVHMLRHVLGDTAFFNGLAAYRQAFDGSSADTEDFKIIMEVTSGRDLDWFFNEWIYGGWAPAYNYGWQQQQINGQNWVRLHVKQTQTPLFAMPIDIGITTAGGTTIRTIWHEAVTEWYLLPAAGNVTGVSFDPDVWILRSSGSSTSYINGPPKLVSMTPSPGAVVSPNTVINQISLTFSEPITWSATDLTVTGSFSGNHSFTANYAAANDTLTLTLDQPCAPGEVWTIQVADTLKSQAANAALDGEVANPANPVSLPSGEGLPGGSSVLQFYTTIAADLDADGDVDTNDLLQRFIPCITGSALGPPAFNCAVADLDGDNDIDGSDFALLQRCLAGAGVHPDPACMNP